MVIRTQKVRLRPNRTMRKALDDHCDYRRYCWNQGLALWNTMYEASLVMDDKKLRPNEREVRDELVANKADWQYKLSSRCLQLAISDLAKAWDNFSTKHSRVGENLSSSRSEHRGKDLKPTEQRLLTANYVSTSPKELKKESGTPFPLMGHDH